MKHAFFIVALALTFTACNTAVTKKTTEQNDTTTTQTTTTTTTTNADLVTTEWKLLELNGKAITIDTSFKKGPTLILDKETKRLAGNAGCNNFMGNYTLKDNNSLEFTLGGTTMMACPNLELETQFLDMLKQVKSYQINGNTLLLSNSDKKEIAKFEVVAE